MEKQMTVREAVDDERLWQMVHQQLAVASVRIGHRDYPLAGIEMRGTQYIIHHVWFVENGGRYISQRKPRSLKGSAKVTVTFGLAVNEPHRIYDFDYRARNYGKIQNSDT